MKVKFVNAKTVDSKSDQARDIYVEDGVIVDFLDDNKVQIIDCEGLYLFPSFTDLHAHFRDPGYTYKEDLKTGSSSALKGGFTAVQLMANTKPIVSSNEIYRDIMNKAALNDLIDIYQVVSITKNFDGNDISHLDNLDSRVRFVSDDGRGVNDDYTMYKAMKKCKEKGLKMTLHEEVDQLSSEDYYLAENLMTIRDCYLSYKLQTPIHFSHVSTEDACKAIEYFKKLNAPITAETTPHHIYFSNRNDLQVNPPIRTEKDRLYLIEMIKKGVIDAIATDHAPHSQEDKRNNAPGYIGLETCFSVCYEKLVLENKLQLTELISLLSYNPSRILGIKKGLFKSGFLADFTLVDLNKSVVYKEKDIVSKSKNSPFIGKTLKGQIKKVYRRGELKYEYNG